MNLQLIYPWWACYVPVPVKDDYHQKLFFQLFNNFTFFLIGEEGEWGPNQKTIPKTMKKYALENLINEMNSILRRDHEKKSKSKGEV